MSLIATTAAASAVSPTVNLFTHGHKKGGHAGFGKDATASSATQGPATTHSLLSSLFESIEQVIGVSLTAPKSAASATAPVTGAVTAAAGASVATMPNASASFSGIGAHIDTKA